MVPSKIPINQFLEGNGKTFFIPVYQRNYAWTKANCEKLWQDMEDLIDNKRVNHFLGTVVAINQGSYQDYAIVDGQQRLTTISILLIALRNFIKQNPNEILSVAEVELYLINQYSPTKDKRIRLKPNKEDSEYFEKLFELDGISDSFIVSNITNNYNYFYSKINEKKINPRQIFDTLSKLIIVLITLEHNDNPQLIFESLNSTGVDLTPGDLIRNYILMDLDKSFQEKFYKDYWVNIEKLSKEKVEIFIRQYLIYKLQESINERDVYSKFKEFYHNYIKENNLIDRNKEEIKESILKNLNYFVKFYSYFIQSIEYKDKQINDRLKRLIALDTSVQNSYLLDVFDDLERKVISSNVALDILKITESYIFRKKIVDSTTQGFNKFFASLSKEIKKYEDWQSRYIDILNHVFLSRPITQRFPTNQEFKDILINKEIYLLKGICKILLKSLENYNSNYIIESIDDLEIEHIMPQTLTKEWKERLGDKWNEIHNKYLHTLGNLSLIHSDSNKDISNDTAEDKCKTYQADKLKLSHKTTEDWNDLAIKSRAEWLSSEAIEIWPYPETTIAAAKEDKNINLFDGYDFIGSKPLFLFLEGNKIEVSYWRDVAKEVFKFIYKISPSSFADLSFDKSSHIHPIEFDDGKYINGCSTNTIISFLKNQCEKVAVNTENFVIQIK